MSKSANIRNAKAEAMSDQALEAVVGGGRSHCEGDDGSSSGGSKPKPKPKTSGGGGNLLPLLL